MVTSEVQIFTPEPGIGLIRLDAPARKNALTGSMARELVDALRKVDADPEIGALVLGGGEEAFCAGADRAVLAAAGKDDDARRDLRSIYEIFETLRQLEVPTVAAVCGPAVGAGLNIALACDVRLVGSNAYLRSMFIANSIHPAGGHLQMLQQLGSNSLAIRLAAFDRPLDAAAAVAAGIAIGPYEPAAVESEAIRFAALAAAQPGLAREIKRSVAVVAGLDAAGAADYEAEAQAASLRSKEASP